MSGTTPGRSSRRDFIRDTGRVAALSTLAASVASGAYAQPDDTIEVALVGCGGRGTGAALNALTTKSGPTKLVAMADLFDDRLQASHEGLTGRLGDQIDVPPERQFLGFDAFRSAIDCLGDNGVVILATPATFRPGHLEYAVATGRNVFMEKSFGVDAPGVRRVIQAGESAVEKGLKIAGGLMSRHSLPVMAAIEQIHDGAIGDVITCWAYRFHDPFGYGAPRPGESELHHQIRNHNCFTWVSGSPMLDWLIHNLDVACWAKDAWPVSAQGMGGRQVRSKPDQLFDHFAVEYTFGDGTRLLAQLRHLTGCWGFFGDVIHGTTGCAVLGEGVPNSRIYRGHAQVPENLIWEHDGAGDNKYQHEHELLFAAIRDNDDYNETARCAQAGMTGILGRMAAESGKEIRWDDALASDLSLAPGLDEFTMDSPAPVMPDADSNYPLPIPGSSVVL